MRSPSKKKDHRNVLAVFSLRTFVGRDLLAGVLDEMSRKKDWHLDTVRPGRFFTERELVNEDGEPFDGYILSMPGTDAAMRRIAASRTPTVLVNITDRRLSARRDAFADRAAYFKAWRTAKWGGDFDPVAGLVVERTGPRRGTAHRALCRAHQAAARKPLRKSRARVLAQPPLVADGACEELFLLRTEKS